MCGRQMSAIKMLEAGKGRRISQRRRTFRPRGNLDALLPRDQSIQALPTEREDDITRELEQHKRRPIDFDPKQHDAVHIRDNITPRAEGERFFRNYPTHYVDHLVNDYEEDSTQIVVNRLYKYLEKDPVGVDPEDHTDRFVWVKNTNVNSDESDMEDVVASDRYSLTSFGETLKVYHERTVSYTHLTLPTKA